MGKIRGSGDPGQVTPDFRIQLRPIFPVFFAPGESLGLVRNPALDDDASAWRDGGDGPQLEAFLRRRAAALTLEIPVRRVHGLPDAAQVRLAVRHPGQLARGL